MSQYIYKHREIMEMIEDTCREDFSRKLEIYLRKEAILSFISEEKEVLDVGCGWAILSVYLAHRGQKVTAADNSQTTLNCAIEMARRYKADITFKLCDAQKLNFPDASFDLVIWEEMLEHLKEPISALKEGLRVLRPKGKIILSVPNCNSIRARMFQALGLKNYLSSPDHKQNFNQDSISKLAEEAGFKIISLTSDFIPFPKLPLSLFLNKRKIFAKRYPSLGHHLIIYGQKRTNHALPKIKYTVEETAGYELENKSGAHKSISIIIPNFNGKELLEENLPILFSQIQKGDPLLPYEVIIVDDGSTDGSPEFIKRNFPSCQVVTLDKNYGFSYAVNVGVRQAKSEIIYLLNSDVKVCKGFLEPLISHFEDKDVFAASSIEVFSMQELGLPPKIGIPLVKFKFGIFWYWYEPIDNPKLKPIEVYCVSGGHSAYDRKKFLSLGGYDTIFKPIYGEDGDICWRAWKKGYRSIIEPKSRVIHKSRGTIGKLYSDSLLQKIHWKVRFLFTWKNLDSKISLFQHFLFTIPELLICFFIGKKEFVSGFYSALKQLPELIKARKRDKMENEIYSDQDLFKRFSHLPNISPFRILYLHDTAKFSGAEESLLNLACFLNKDGFEPFFVLPEEGRFSRKLQDKGVKVFKVPLPRIRSMHGVMSSARMILKIATENCISLVHTNSIRTHIYGVYLAKRLKAPIIWHERNLIRGEMIDLDRLFSFLPDKIICNSYAIAKRFASKDIMIQEHNLKTVVIHNGVDTQRFNPGVSGERVREELGIKPGEVVIGIASRFGQDKGHETFFEAAQILTTYNLQPTTYRFLVVGDAVFEQDRWREKYLRELVENLGLSDRVIFTGFCEDMSKLYAAMDIFVLASEAEPCGRVLLEAMASGKPVVATNSAGTPEIVKNEETGFLVEPKKPEDLARRIAWLISNPKIARDMGIKGRERVEENFKIEANVAKIQKVYDSLLNK